MPSSVEQNPDAKRARFVRVAQIVGYICSVVALVITIQLWFAEKQSGYLVLGLLLVIGLVMGLATEVSIRRRRVR